MSTAIAEYNEFEAKMVEFKKTYDNVVYDLTDPVHEKKARSDKYSIGKVISALDKKHDALKEPLKVQVDLIDGERKRIKDELLEIQGKIKDQIKAHEDAIRKHAEMLEEKVIEIRALASFDEFAGFPAPDSKVIGDRLSKAKSIDVDDSYEHRKADATLAQVETIKTLESLLSERLKHEAEQAELEKLRQEKEERDRLEREETIRREAAEKAKREAEEAAERAKQEAEQKAENIRRAAELKAKQEQEAAQAEADRKVREAEERGRKAVEEERAKIAAEAKAKQEKEAAEAKKKAKQTHRAKIHSGIKGSFIERGLDDETATLVVELIKDRKIAHVVIEY